MGEYDGVYLHRNEHWLPRAFVVDRVHQVGDLAEALVWLAENDPGFAAAVETDGTWPKTDFSGDPTNTRVKKARMNRLTPNRIEVEAEGPGLLVLSEVYDPDWRVEVDNQGAELVRTDGILRGALLEEGVHQVTFVYRPAGLWVGCVVSAGGWLLALALWIVGRAGRRPGGMAVLPDQLPSSGVGDSE